MSVEVTTAHSTQSGTTDVFVRPRSSVSDLYLHLKEHGCVVVKGWDPLPLLLHEAPPAEEYPSMVVELYADNRLSLTEVTRRLESAGFPVEYEDHATGPSMSLANWLLRYDPVEPGRVLVESPQLVTRNKQHMHLVRAAHKALNGPVLSVHRNETFLAVVYSAQKNKFPFTERKVAVTSPETKQTRWAVSQ